MLYFLCTQDLASNHAIQTENVICILMNMGETFIFFWCDLTVLCSMKDHIYSSQSYFPLPAEDDVCYLPNETDICNCCICGNEIFFLAEMKCLFVCYPDWECNLYFDEYGRNFHFFLVFETNYSRRSLYCIHVVLLWYDILEAMSFISAKRQRDISSPQEKIFHFHKCNNYRYLFR
jgi:hypothetical protein